MAAMQEKIHVIIRFRPPNKRERKEEKKSNLDNDSKQIIFQNNDKRGIGAIEIYGKKSNEPKRFTFDRILDDDISQEETFTHVAEHVCNDVIAGYNGCIFAYGQTGSGKTYTMFGPENNESNPQLMGIIPRSVSYILSEIQSDDNILESRIQVSFIEIYKEKLRDLLNPKSKKQLTIRLNANQETRVANMTQTPVSTLPDVLKLITIANGYRTKAATSMNASSSRSHMVMILTTYTKVKDGSIRAGQANFCDLAGSEKVRKTNAKGNTLKEAQKINLSLTILGQVISSLGGKNKHIPYRDSKLTHLLKDSLGGNCKTTLIVNATKHIFNRDETLISLRFGSRCKLITNKVKMNKIYGKKELMSIINELKQANEDLRFELKEARSAETSGMFDPTANVLFAKKEKSDVEKLENTKQELEDALEDYKRQMDELKEGNQSLTEENRALKENNDEMTDQLQQSESKCAAAGTEISNLKEANEEMILEIKSLNHTSKERELELEELRKDQSFESTKLNEELQRFKSLHQDQTQETVEFVNEINKLKNSAEKSQMIVHSQQNQLSQNTEKINELEKQLMDKTKALESYDEEMKQTQTSLDELREALSSQNDEMEELKQNLEHTTKELSGKNRELEEQIAKMEFEKELQLAAALEPVVMDIDDTTSPFIDRQVTVDEIVKTATMFDETEETHMILNQMSILDEVAYLQRLETKRITKRNTQLMTMNVQDMIIQEDLEEKASESDYIAEKMKIEADIKEQTEKLDSMRLMTLPKDGKKRMNLLIDIAIAEDDIAVLQRNLEAVLSNISHEDGDENVAAYQEAVYGNKQPMMKLKMEKSVEFIEKEKTTTAAGFDFGETMYGDFDAVAVTGELLKELEVKLKKGLELKDRKKKTKTHKNCFVGKEAVTFMIENGICSTREQGVMLGNRLKSNGVIAHVTNKDYAFKDKKLLYRFVDLEENMNGIYSFVFRQKPFGVTFGNNSKKKKKAKNLYIVSIEPHSNAIGNVYLESQVVRFENENVEGLHPKQIFKIFSEKYANKMPIKITFRRKSFVKKTNKKKKPK